MHITLAKRSVFLSSQYKTLSIVISDSSDPYYNLALEQSILESLKKSEKCLLLYQNRKCVVMGRFQNPWLECNIRSMKTNNIDLVRRQSGGGCVYHDLNNLNFCFLQSEKYHDKEQNNKIILNALSALEINAYLSQRSDLLVNQDGPKKFSGSAFKQKKDRSFHHGTLLINSDLKMLNHYLHTDQLNIESKSTKSVRSSVINLKSINESLDSDKLIESLRKSFGDFFDLEVKMKSINDISFNSEYFNEINKWQWIFGETPLFENSSEDDSYLINVKVKKAQIIDIEILDKKNILPQLISLISDSLNGLLVKEDLIEAKFNSLLADYNEYKKSIINIRDIIYSLFSFS